MRAFIISLVVFITMIWLVGDSEVFKSCIRGYQNYRDYPSNQPLQESISQILITIRPYRTCIGTFIHDNGEAIIALFTVVLAFSTIFLWVATRDLVRGAEKVAKTQLRAFVFGNRFEQAASMHFDANGQRFVGEWVFWVKIENVGLTPAIDVRLWIKHQTLPTCENIELHFEWNERGPTAIIGPRGIGQSSYHPIPISEMVALWEFRNEVYLATRIEYRDIFDPSVNHHHEQCFMLDLVRHPADVETGPDDQQNLPRVVMRAYGPQNTIS